MFIDLLDGNAPIKFETQAQIKQCPCNCYMAMLNGSGSFPSISGTGKSDDWVTIALNTSGYYIKRGTFVKGNANVILLPCEKYVQNDWYFDADSEITRWLPNTAGRYKVEMAGGKGGDAAVSGLSKTGGNGRKLIFEVDVQTPDIFTLSVGQSQAAVAGDPPQYQWITNTGLNGGGTTFLNISVPGGTGATAKAFRGDYGWIINQSGTDGTTPEPPTEDEVRNGLPEGVTYVEGSYDGSETSDHGYISIFRIEENA